MQSVRACPSAGDLVLLYERHDSISPVYLTENALHQCRFGVFDHNEMIGRPFGSVIASRPKGPDGRIGWLYMLPPTPPLWTESLPHRTQIVYNMDASYICLGLYLRQGSVVLESGTGTGSLTTHFALGAGPSGHVHTCEFNAQRAEKADAEFTRNGLGEQITVYHRDVCADGFPESLNGQMDAAFLDLPQPWLAIAAARRALRRGGRLCTFSPCIEQVQNTCQALRENGFDEIETVEALVRPYELLARRDAPSAPSSESDPEYWRPKEFLCRPEAEARGHTSYLTFCSLF